MHPNKTNVTDKFGKTIKGERVRQFFRKYRYREKIKNIQVNLHWLR